VPSTEPLDGRLARSARTRQAILDALRTLFIGGDLRPTAPSIAAEAGVSVRTVWQHFDDLQALWAEAGQREMERALAFAVPIDAGLPLVGRITALVDQRSQMYEELGPVWRAARLHEPFSPEVRSSKAQLYDAGRAQLVEVFAAELSQVPSEVRVGAEVAAAWSTWDTLRSDLKLDEGDARAAVRALLAGLLT
jgi:TetR/AcrR family transcriptional regulator of autoinduction and epiphytic fitness